MKYNPRKNLEPLHIKEAISTLLGARLHLGQTLYFSFNTHNKNLKKRKTSLARFMRAVENEYPSMSRRNYLRSYRVFERLVQQCGFWMSNLEEVDFTLLAQIAECKNILPLTRRELVKGVQKRMAAGESYGQIAKRLGEVLRIYRERPPRIPDVVAEVDHRLSDVKMDFRLTYSAKDPPEPKFNIPDDYWDMGIPRVVNIWDNEEID